jgi:hypothetical protein
MEGLVPELSHQIVILGLFPNELPPKNVLTDNDQEGGEDRRTEDAQIREEPIVTLDYERESEQREQRGIGDSS